MRTLHLLLLLAVAAFAGACSTGSTVSTTNGGDGVNKTPTSFVALLEREYENFAWGHQHFGVVIAADGEIRSYERKLGVAQWERPDSKTISAAQLDQKYAPGLKVVGRVSADTLRLINSLVSPAVAGTLTATTQAGADMGQTTRTIYQYDAANQTYAATMLATEGDHNAFNTAAAARQLTAIIDAIAQRYRK